MVSMLMWGRLGCEGRRALAKFDGQGVEEKFGIAGGVDMPHALIAKVHSSSSALVKFPLCARAMP